MIVKNNPIQFLNNSTIYIMAPAGVATGGPEALHQLGHILKKHLNLKLAPVHTIVLFGIK